MSDSTETKTCPKCGRNVEPGFRFCDSCGQPLASAAPPTPAPPTPPPPIITPPPASEKVEPPKPPPAPAPKPAPPTFEFDRPRPEKVDLPAAKQPEAPPAERKAPLLQRLRERRQEKKEDNEAWREFAPRPPEETKPKEIKPDEPKPETPKPPPPKPVVEAPARPPMERPIPAPIPTPPPRPIERPAASTTTTEWRPIVREKEVEETGPGFTPRVLLVWLLHLVFAFACGAILVAAAGAIASVVSNGRSALLEIRGLPIFIGGATAVIVFTLLRTGRVRDTARRSVIALTVIIGFIVLVVAAAVLYRPPIMHSAQTRLDRLLRVYGPTEKEAVDDFEGDVSDWNNELDHYRNDILAPSLRANADLNRFRFDASGSEETMNGIIGQMRTHADAANNVRIRDALNGLAAIYDDQRSGINLITRGVINSDQTLVAQGDRRYKDGQKRTVEYFRLRVKPLLERAGLDVQSFENAVSP